MSIVLTSLFERNQDPLSDESLRSELEDLVSSYRSSLGCARIAAEDLYRKGVCGRGYSLSEQGLKGLLKDEEARQTYINLNAALRLISMYLSTNSQEFVSRDEIVNAYKLKYKIVYAIIKKFFPTHTRNKHSKLSYFEGLKLAERESLSQILGREEAKKVIKKCEEEVDSYLKNVRPNFEYITNFKTQVNTLRYNGGTYNFSSKNNDTTLFVLTSNIESDKTYYKE